MNKTESPLSKPAWRRFCRCLNPMSHSQVWWRYHAESAKEKCFGEQTNRTPSSLTNNLGSITSIIYNGSPCSFPFLKTKTEPCLSCPLADFSLTREVQQSKYNCALRKLSWRKIGTSFDNVWTV